MSHVPELRGPKKLYSFGLRRSSNNFSNKFNSSSYLCTQNSLCSDRAGEVCDETNWRDRGWCRLELVGAVLARVPLHLMVVRNATATPELSFPADALHLVPGLGSFTCCMMAHDNGDGPGSRPCDRPSVASIMDTMINSKVRL